MLKRKPKYKLEIGAETFLPKSLANRKTGTSFSITQKITFLLIAAAVFISTGIAGLTGFTPEAHAIKVDPISDMLCPTVSNGTSYLGGISQPIIDGFEGKTDGAPWEGLFGVWSVPKADQDNISKGNAVQHSWTTLERYGYYGTKYTNWIGMQTHYPLERILDEVFSDGKLPYMGTGGNPGGFGQFMYIIDGESSPLFSKSLMDCIPIASHSIIAAANTFQAMNQTVSALTLNFYYMSSNLSLSDDNSILRPLGEVFETVIAGDSSSGTKGLKDLLFLEFMLPLIMGGAIVVFLRYMRTWSMLKVMQQVLWILFIAVLGMVLLSKPLLISSTVDKVVNTVTGALGEAVLGTGARSAECQLPSGEPQKVEREISCYLWMQNVYAFWVEGQFGVSYEEGKKMKTDPAVKADVTEYGPSKDADTYVGLNASNWAGINKSSFAAATSESSGSETKRGSANFLAMTALGYDPKTYYPDYETMFENSKPVGAPERADGTRGVFASFDPHLGQRKGVSELKNWPYYQMDSSSNWPVSNGYNHSEVAYNQLVMNNNVYWKNPTNAATISLISLGYSIIPNIITFLFALTLITLQISLTMLIIVAPFFFALGLIPGFGARVFYKWVNMITGITVRRILITFFFFLYLKLYFIILNLDMDIMMKLLIIIVFSAIMFSLKDTIASAIVKNLQIGDGAENMSDIERQSYAKALAAGEGAMSVVRQIRSGERKSEYHKYEARRQAAKRERRRARREEREYSRNPGAEYASENYNPFEAAAADTENKRRRRGIRGLNPEPAVVSTEGTIAGAEHVNIPGAAVGAGYGAGRRNQPDRGSSNENNTPRSSSSALPGDTAPRLALSSGREKTWQEHGFQDPNRTYSSQQNLLADSYLQTATMQSKRDLANLTPEQKTALSMYTSSSYHRVNEHLMTGQPITNKQLNDYISGATTENGNSLKDRINKVMNSDAPNKEELVNNLIAKDAKTIARELSYEENVDYSPLVKQIDSSFDNAERNTEITYRGVAPYAQDFAGKSHEDIMEAFQVGTMHDSQKFESTSYDPKTAQKFAGWNGIIFETKTGSGISVQNISQQKTETERLLPRNKNYKVVGLHHVEVEDHKIVVVQRVEIDDHGKPMV